MNTWIVEFGYSIVFFGVLAVLLVVPWVELQYKRFGLFRGWPAVVSASIVLYACSLVAFTLFPLPTFTEKYCSKRHPEDYWNLRPGTSLDDVFVYADAHGVTATLTSGVFLQIVFNVIFFIPLGIYVAYRYRRGLGTAFVAGLGVSLAIELTQGTGVWGLAPCPYRMADTDDLITNTSGALIGWVIGKSLVQILPDARPVHVEDFASPTRRRRVLSIALNLMTYLVPAVAIEVIWRRIGGAPESGSATYITFSLVLTFVLFVGVPALRKDRAGPGDAAVRIALVDVRAQDPSTPAPRWSLIVRWVLRWVPFAFFGLVVLLPILLAEFIVSTARKDRRSISDLVSQTLWQTRDLAQRNREPNPRAPDA